MDATNALELRRERTVMALAKNVAAGGRAIARKAPQRMEPLHATDEQIRVRAYEIFRTRGGARGDAIADWLEAERELSARPSDPVT